MPNINFKLLSEMSELIEKEKDDEIDYTNVSLRETLDSELLSDNNDTISLHYNIEHGEIVLQIKGSNDKLIKRRATPDEYLELCESINIVENNDYNCSANLKRGNVWIRVFALTRPISEYPNITISTAKKPPMVWGQPQLVDLLIDVAQSNFLLVGASGAGKTYLMNYMLKIAHEKTNSKIGIVEEFNELFAPNEYTSKLLVPTPKPNKPRLLEFVTEQSNLMRLDYLYVGEIKGSESWPFVLNLSSGTRGGCTVHGSSAMHGLKRLKDLCTLANVSEAAACATISTSIKYIVYVKDHKIREIKKLTGLYNANSKTFAMEDIYKE